ncbi:glucuronate isomerase [Caldanaerobacter subterraneus]|uniref:Uronate isomerase n=2 Tax=Caldanaerobacter subterraneus TaxID=911092 RepID=UXAC_CALS4|nr:glucuronate isomerase [Caldanaerobacter subterraneus]Q8R8Q6.1 RecName: Full=Uronate isomerase; AltName: Full=Glucuronate isomerase; AltName: Full=Uronic isomerase [Caldanaerobacter subterraneus subsp. tengcongensis MB4]AAM25118.1 Glucuronate isomerase [Caldanaerobacter subterraneus subsp. tengcongensis MB4]
MRKFMDEDFLLTNETAVKLYHQYAKDMSIYDFHCHLSPKEIYEDRRFKNITEVWLYGDHYKWRLMRANGIDEKYITGDADDYEKFVAYAKTIPMAIGNPVYHWTHLELQRYFGIYDLLNEKTAKSIWERANEVISQEDFSARNILKKSNVKVVITTDDPVDSLEYHIKLKEEKDFDIKVLPAFRPDKGLNIEKDDFLSWIKKLESASGIKITTYDDFLQALEKRIEFFHSVGCRISDHALDYVFYQKTSKQEAEKVFKKVLTEQHLTKEEIDSFKTYTMIFLGKKYAELNWVMQLHIGAMRNNNTKMYRILGPDTGYDSIGDFPIAYSLSRLLDSLEIEGALPKTILYTLNPAANYVIATMIGNFQDGKIAGKMQFGAAWWFNDNKDGIKEQLKTLANVGLLGRFVGMVTDSRSFLSYARHEYFRRILCDLIGEWVENGEVPNDIELLGKIVQDISFNNAKEYMGV